MTNQSPVLRPWLPEHDPAVGHAGVGYEGEGWVERLAGHRLAPVRHLLQVDGIGLQQSCTVVSNVFILIIMIRTPPIALLTSWAV